MEPSLLNRDIVLDIGVDPSQQMTTLWIENYQDKRGEKSSAALLSYFSPALEASNNKKQYLR